MKTKKLMLSAGLALLGSWAYSQNGLVKVEVEKYYISNAADAADADNDATNAGVPTGALPAGSTTYRVYADMLPGYKFESLYGNIPHPMKMNTSTSFYNNSAGGNTPTNWSRNSVKNSTGNVLGLDSWFSVGGAANNAYGILKSEDSTLYGPNLITTVAGNVLQNNAVTIPLTAKDGYLYSGFAPSNLAAPQSVTYVGLTTELNVFTDGSTVGNSFTTTNGAIASLNGSVGPTSSNKVLVGQFTVSGNGTFTFQMNIQIGTPGGGTQNYVWNTPAAGELTIPSLVYPAPTVAPVVSITAPSAGSTYTAPAVVGITATASEVGGTVTSVQFYVDGVSVGTANAAPYTANYTSAVGTHSLTAVATDNTGNQTTSAPVSITVTAAQPPTVTISAPLNATVYTAPDVVAITANASASGTATVKTVQIFVDGTSVAIDSVAPYTANYTSVVGTHSITAKATDSKGGQATSAAVSITVVANIPPFVNITAPANGAVYTAPAIVSITAAARDTDGTVSKVEFFVNGVSIGIKNAAPYQINWTSVIGTANITAKATDNRGAVTTSSVVTLQIADPNALPYTIVNQKNTCLPSSFCMPILAVDSVKNVIGYDLVMHYDKSKVLPTGNISLYSDLINSNYVTSANSLDTANGLVNLSLYLNASAPANATFHGKGKIACVEFTKKMSFHSIDTAKFTVTSLQESYYSNVATKLVQGGVYTTYTDSTFHGSLKFWLDNSPLAYNAAVPSQFLITNIFGNNASCSSKSAVAVQPDLGGNFSYNIKKGVDVDIERDIAPTTDVQPVINGIDAQLARRVLISDPTFVPSVYQMVAMDVNLDGIISAGDVSQINQRSVLLIPEFKQAWNYNNQGVSNGSLSKDWLFLDFSAVGSNPAYAKSATFPQNDGVGYSKAKVPAIPFCQPVPVTDLSNCPVINSNTYEGVMLGDVNGNFKTVGSGGVFKTTGTLNPNDKVIFDLSKAKVTGKVIDIPVSISSVDVINALDFSFQFNEGNMTFDTILGVANYMQSVYHYNTNDKTFRFTSNSLQNYQSNGQILATMRFTMLNSGVTGSDFTTVKAYLNGDATNALVIDSPLGIVNQGTAADIRIYPNPTNGLLHVELTASADVQMVDLEGRVVYTKSMASANQTLDIDTQDLANGVYLLEASNANFVTIKKIVINK
jgi:hypothetical protein